MRAPQDNLSHDPVHGYISFSSGRGLHGDEVSERAIIDDPWVQRLRQIHQLQTAWWVYPTAEHTRFQHVLGAMHLGSRVVDRLYASLVEVCGEAGDMAPSRGYVESTLRMAGLLHDVGHGPFGHFFDEHFLRQYGLNHEKLGAHIIQHELGRLLRRIRRNPNSQLRDDETLDPAQIAWLIQRPSPDDDPGSQPMWLRFMRGLLGGIYTIDNMDFVLRDAFMSGYSTAAFDLQRLLHYSFFTARGLTIADRGMGSLLRFMTARADLFRTVYFHRTVRAIDLTLADIFPASRDLLFPGNPLENLDRYRQFTETTLLVDVSRWSASSDPRTRELGAAWNELLARRIPWRMACQRSLLFGEHDVETSSIFSDPQMVRSKLIAALPESLRSLPLRVDIARHIYRPHTRGPAPHQNFFYDSARDQIRPLSDDQLFRHPPVSSRICRIYTQDAGSDAVVASALDSLLGSTGPDDLTNM